MVIILPLVNKGSGQGFTRLSLHIYFTNFPDTRVTAQGKLLKAGLTFGQTVHYAEEMSKKSPSRRVERKQQLRDEILRVASVLFAEHGYENVTLRGIAEEIGYSHATIYQHFTDKSEILACVFQSSFKLIENEFDRLAATPLEPVQRLFATSRGLIHFCVSHPEHLRAAFLGPETLLGGTVGKQIADTGNPLFEKFLAIFNQAVKSSGFKLKRLNETAVTWGHSVFGLAIVLTIQGELPDGYLSKVPHDYTIEQSLRWMWDGIVSESQPRLSK